MSLEKYIYKILRLSKLPDIFLSLIPKNTITILLYHNPQPEAFEQQILWLKKRFTLISLESYQEVLSEGKNLKLSKPGLILTFDDGNKENYLLLPILQKHEIPVCIFVCSGIIDTCKHFWFLWVKDKKHKHKLKSVSNKERLSLLEKMNFHQDMEFPTRMALNKEEILEMKPWVSFQAHTRYHPCLPTCTETEARAEIFSCKKELEEKFKLKCFAFAYPNGDFTDRDEKLVKMAAYDCALTVDPGRNTFHSDPYRLKRFVITQTDNLDELICKTSGILSPILRIKRWRRKQELKNP